jgi:hypothetical protein
MLMQTYLNKNSFREKIFRLRVNEETFNVKYRKFILYMIIIGFFLRMLQWLKSRVYQLVILILVNMVVV